VTQIGVVIAMLCHIEQIVINA